MVGCVVGRSCGSITRTMGSFVMMALWAGWNVGVGLFDAISFWRSAVTVRLSPFTQAIIGSCLLLNGLLMGGSAILLRFAIGPMLSWLLTDDRQEEREQ